MWKCGCCNGCVCVGIGVGVWHVDVCVDMWSVVMGVCVYGHVDCCNRCMGVDMWML